MAFAVVVTMILLFSPVIGPGVLSLWREIGLQTCGLRLETIWYNRFRVKNLSLWIEARKRFHLSHAQIQMARELGMNPKKFGKFANHRQEPWKQPLPQFIERIYSKHFGKACPDRVLPLEDWTKQEGAKKQEKKQRRQERREQARLEAEAVAPAAHAAFINTQMAESRPDSTATSAMLEMPSSTHPSSCARPS
jgi:hypothetical protein